MSSSLLEKFILRGEVLHQYPVNKHIPAAYFAEE